VRSVQLTAAGRRERGVLDRRSDELAQSLLEPLSPAQRERLVAAMAEVERLLTAGLVQIDVVDPEEPAAAYCLGEYYSELGRRFDDGWDHAISIAATPEQLRPPAGLFVVARLHGAAVGCGALKFHGRGPAELKRMWVAPSARGLGLGRRLLAELERLAAAQGVRVIRLETNRNLTEAIELYRSTGYREVAAFNDEPYAHHWFEKRLKRLDASATEAVPESARTPRRGGDGSPRSRPAARR
jgi:ribosomal protein S18 acetylase RimI-like enzyme